mgnify:CR=1 FL=1
MEITIQELFNIMAKSCKGKMKDTIGIGKSAFYRVTKHNTNIKMHNALYFIDNFGFELKAINKATGEEYTIKREKEYIARNNHG